MKKKIKCRRLIVTLATVAAVVMAATILRVTGQVAQWVADVTVGAAALYLAFLFGWGAGKMNWRWRL